MHPAFPEPGVGVAAADVAQKESWLQRLWTQNRADRSRDAAMPQTDQDSLLAFASESKPQATIPIAATTRGRNRRRLQLTRSQVALAVLGLIAVTQGALIAVWLQSDGLVTLPETGSVTISSEPSGATVSVDSQPRGATPIQVSLAPGDHQITVGQGADVHTRAITVARGSDATLHVELRTEPAAAAPVITTGTLQINSDPRGAQVSVDGRARGTAPVTVPNLTPGAHTVAISGATGTVSQTAIVREGTVSSVMMAMTNQQYASGWVAISSQLPLQIYEAGTLVGSTDAPRIMLSASRHDLELVNTALKFRARRTVQITPGKTTSITLEVPNGTVHINALPWAEVSIGARVLGETPIANLSLPIGSYELVFRHPELGEQKKAVTVRAGEPVRVGIDLRKAPQ